MRVNNFNAHQHQALMLCFQSLLNHAQEPLPEDVLGGLTTEMKKSIGDKSGSCQFFVVRKLTKEISERKSCFDGKITLRDIEKVIYSLYDETESDFDMCLYLITANSLVKYGKAQELGDLIRGANSTLQLKL